MTPTERVEGSWGIEPVPARLQVLGGVETGLLWGNLGVSLLVIVAGAVLVPALSLPDALVAILRRLPHREPDARDRRNDRRRRARPGHDAHARAARSARLAAPDRGSTSLQGIGWTVFELLVIATAAAALSDELFGFRAQWLWTIVFGVCALVLALLGPIGFVRRFIRRFAIWAVPLALLYLTWWAIDGADSVRSGMPTAREGSRLARRRRRRRDHGLVDAVCSGLHAVLEVTPRRAGRNRARLLHARRLAARTRRSARALARPRRSRLRFPLPSSPEVSPRSSRCSRCS